MAQSLRPEAWAKLVAALSASLQRVKDSLHGRGARPPAGVSSGAVRRPPGFEIRDSRKPGGPDRDARPAPA